MTIARARVFVTGPTGSGKSSLLSRLSGASAPVEVKHVPTLGLHNSSSNLILADAKDADHRVELRFSELGGGEYSRDVTFGYYTAGVSVIVFVIDGNAVLTERDRVQMLGFANSQPPTVPRILVINKMVKASHEAEAKSDDSTVGGPKTVAGAIKLTPAEIAKLSTNLQVHPADVVYTSAKTGIVTQLTDLIYKKVKELIAQKRIAEEPFMLEPSALEFSLLPSDSKRAPEPAHNGETKLQPVVDKTELPISLAQQKDMIDHLFEQAIRITTPSASQDNTVDFSQGSLKDYTAYLRLAKTRVIADLSSKTISYEDALGCANGAKILTRKIAKPPISADDISNFDELAQPAMQKSTGLSKILGGLIGAALGFFLGVIIGAFAPPAGAFAALALAKAGAVAGAVVGTAIGGMVFSYVSSKVTLWNHPLMGMESAAKKLLPQNAQPTPTPTNTHTVKQLPSSP